MTGSELHEIMATLLPESVLATVAEKTGFHQRDRMRDAIKFLRTMLVSASSPSGGRQADIMRQYFEAGAEKIVRGSFYDWFGPPLEAALADLREVALEFVRCQPVDLPGTLAGVRDWRIVDSTTVKLHDRLKSAYPGAGDYAAVKVHKTLSVGCGSVVDYHFSAARDHDSPHLVLDEGWRGYGLFRPRLRQRRASPRVPSLWHLDRHPAQGQLEAEGHPGSPALTSRRPSYPIPTSTFSSTRFTWTSAMSSTSM